MIMILIRVVIVGYGWNRDHRALGVAKAIVAHGTGDDPADADMAFVPTTRSAASSGHDGSEEGLFVVERCQDHTADFGTRGADVSADLDPAAIGQARASSNATSGRAAGIRRSASPACAPSPTTSMSSVEPSRSVRPRLTSSWSSRMKTRMMRSPSYIDSGIDHRSRGPPCSWFSRVNVPPRL
jgi:hypothetical protein